MPARVRDLSRFESPVHTYKSMEALVTAPPRDGISTVAFKRFHFDVRFTDRGHDATLVHLGAALPAAERFVPKFGGGLLSESLPVNHLSIADPNTALPSGYATGWYCGHAHFDARKWIPEVVAHFAQGGHTVYFGSSAGGYGALIHSATTFGASCVTVNPRTSLFQLPSKFPEYAELAFRGHTPEQIEAKTAVRAWDLHQGGETPLWYVQNMEDDVYRDNHYAPFREHVGNHPNIRYVTGTWGAGHIVPPREMLTAVIQEALQSSRDHDGTAVPG